MGDEEEGEEARSEAETEEGEEEEEEGPPPSRASTACPSGESTPVARSIGHQQQNVRKANVASTSLQVFKAFVQAGLLGCTIKSLRYLKHRVVRSLVLCLAAGGVSLTFRNVLALIKGRDSIYFFSSPVVQCRSSS